VFGRRKLTASVDIAHRDLRKYVDCLQAVMRMRQLRRGAGGGEQAHRSPKQEAPRRTREGPDTLPRPVGPARVAPTPPSRPPRSRSSSSAIANIFVTKSESNHSFQPGWEVGTCCLHAWAHPHAFEGRPDRCAPLLVRRARGRPGAGLARRHARLLYRYRAINLCACSRARRRASGGGPREQQKTSSTRRAESKTFGTLATLGRLAASLSPRARAQSQ
jgi:hypothetical protein